MEETAFYSGDKFDRLLKIVLFGPESTGKTTLAKDLAAFYSTEWVPEFMRIYLEEKLESGQTIQKEDLVPIAKGQLKLEQEIAERVDELLICDTNLLELKVYSEYYYFGYCPEFIIREATNREYDIYLLTNIDVPWEPDPLRDRPLHREEMFRLFESELKAQNLPYRIMSGNREKRLNDAVSIIEELRKKLSNQNGYNSY